MSITWDDGWTEKRIDNTERWSLTDGLLRGLLHCAKKKVPKTQLFAEYASHVLFSLHNFVFKVLFNFLEFFDFTDKDADNLEETEARKQGVTCSSVKLALTLIFIYFFEKWSEKLFKIQNSIQRVPFLLGLHLFVCTKRLETGF